MAHLMVHDFYWKLSKFANEMRGLVSKVSCTQPMFPERFFLCRCHIKRKLNDRLNFFSISFVFLWLGPSQSFNLSIFLVAFTFALNSWEIVGRPNHHKTKYTKLIQQKMVFLLAKIYTHFKWRHWITFCTKL